MTFLKTRATISTTIAAGLLAAMTSGASSANLVKSFRDWSLFTHDAAGTKVCFAASQPKSTAPEGANRDSIFFYVSAWPKDGVKSEVSVRLGYPIKPGSTVSVQVGSDRYSLFAKDDKAFVADPTEELKLIEAMKRGSTMQVKGISTRGTNTSDRYSLSGVTAAIEALAQACP